MAKPEPGKEAVLPTPLGAGWGRRFLWDGAIALLAVVCFLNTLPNDYAYDDVLVVEKDPKVTGGIGWGEIWSSDYWSHHQSGLPNRDLLYRPLTVSSFRVVYTAVGESPVAQRVVNLALHVVVCLLVFRLASQTGAAPTAAVLGGCVFAVLPIHTDAVAALVGRADLLATAGVLLALVCHRRFLEAGQIAPKATWASMAGVAAFGALTAKESGAAVVPLLVLYDAYWCGRRGCGRWLTVRTVGRLAYVVVPAAVYVVLRYVALGGQLVQAGPETKTINVLVDAPLWQHVLGVAQLWGMYWSKTVWPAVLSIKYSVNYVRLATTVLDPHVVIGGMVLVAMAIGSLLAWRWGERGVAVMAAAVLLAYLPTSNAIVLMQVFFAERVWYLPSVWAVMLLATALAPMIRRWPRPGGATVALIVTAMVVRCWDRSADWRNNGTLYAAAYRDQPDAVGPMQLYGQWLAEHGRLDEGIRLLKKAVAIDVGFADAHRALGRAHMAAGHPAAAMRHLRVAESLAPGHVPTQRALAEVSRLLSGRDAGTLAELRRAADENPRDVEAALGLIRWLRDTGRVDEALTELRAPGATFEDDAQWQAEYAVTLVFADRVDEAIERYRRALALEPDRPQRAVELAMLLLERRGEGDVAEARRWAERAYKLAPTMPSVLACRAELLAVAGEIAEAVAVYERAIELLPEESPLRGVYEQRARVLGRE